MFSSTYKLYLFIYDMSLPIYGMILILKSLYGAHDDHFGGSLVLGGVAMSSVVWLVLFLVFNGVMVRC